ncbi:MAG: hypothetical protein Q4Q03_00140 [Bowdeniella nasicola]|nr:hypothetical protein [Bowdeniella nasicola]
MRHRDSSALTAVAVVTAVLTLAGSARIYPSSQPLFQAGVCPARTAAHSLEGSGKRPLRELITEIPVQYDDRFAAHSPCQDTWQAIALDATSSLAQLRQAA